MKVSVQGRSAYAYTGGKPFDPTLPCVVFVHGALNDHTVWTLPARWFAHHGHSVLAVDLPGHMRSDGPALQDVASMARWLLELLDAAGVKQASLVGHSMGSLICLEATGRAPERVKRLAMVGTAYPMKVSESLLDTSREQPLKAIDSVVSFSLSSLANKPSYPGPGTWLHGSQRSLMRRVLAHQQDGLLFHTDFMACDRYAGAPAAAAKVTCPVTFVLASRDQMTRPGKARELAQALKARTIVLPAGHALMAEAPDGLLNALKEALLQP